jgi:hypothetical protein
VLVLFDFQFTNLLHELVALAAHRLELANNLLLFGIRLHLVWQSKIAKKINKKDFFGVVDENRETEKYCWPCHGCDVK